MSKRGKNDSNKITLLTFMKERKEVLFGRFTNTLTNSKKEEAWKEVLEVAKELKLCDESKDFKHTRDVIWQNIKKRTTVSTN